MTTDQKGTVLLRVAGGVIVRVSTVGGQIRALRVPYPAPTTLAPGDTVTLSGTGGQVRVEAVRRE